MTFFFGIAPPLLYYDLNWNLTRYNLVVLIIFRIFAGLVTITGKLLTSETNF